MENLLNNNANNQNINNNMIKIRVNRGRQRVEMVKMTNESNLQVTFSKRRTGLFKKASELCTLCGAEMVLVVFSPGRKVFSFGHPSVEAVLERYVQTAHCYLPDPPALAGAARGASQLIEAHRSANLRDLNFRLSQVLGQLDAERRRSEEMNRVRRAGQVEHWWENPAEELCSLTQLGQLRKSMADLKKIVSLQADRIMIQATAAVNNTAPAVVFNRVPPLPPFFSASPVGSATGIMLSYPNLNNNNSNPGAVVNHGMMNMPPPPPPKAQPQPHPRQNPNPFNTIGYGRGFY